MSIPLPQTPGAGGAEEGEGKSTFRASAPDARGLQIGSLTFDEISKANRSAQIDGVMAGTCAGFLGSFASSRLFRQNRNIALISGLMTGVLTGYYFTQASLSTHLAQASLSATTLKSSLERARLASTGEMPEGADPLTWKFDREGGVGGMEEMHDKCSTSRGDH